MKNTPLVLLGLLFSYAATAQSKPHFGLKAGLNVSSIKFSNVSKNNMDPRLGFHIGALAHIHFTPEFGVQPELLYTTEGAKQQLTRSEKVLWKTDYINVPVMFQYMFDNGFRIEGGPQFGLLVSGKSEDERGIEGDEGDFFKTGSVSLGVGLGYLSYSGFGISGRYVHGLSNILEAGNGTGKANTFQASLFYMLDRNHKAKSR